MGGKKGGGVCQASLDNPGHPITLFIRRLIFGCLSSVDERLVRIFDLLII